MPYNYNPLPQFGVANPYGAIPGAIEMPDPFADLSAVAPWLPAANKQVGSNLLSGLMGELSQPVRDELRNFRAEQAQRSGMPGLSPGSLQTNALGRDLGLRAGALQQQAMQNYGPIVNTLKTTQTNSPEFQAGLSNLNSINAGAANPTIKGLYEQGLFNDYMRLTGARSPAGGTGGQLWNPSGGTVQPPTRMGSMYQPPQPQNPAGGVTTNASGMEYDPATGTWWDPTTGWLFDNQGRFVDPGQTSDPGTFAGSGKITGPGGMQVSYPPQPTDYVPAVSNEDLNPWTNLSDPVPWNNDQGAAWEDKFLNYLTQPTDYTPAIADKDMLAWKDEFWDVLAQSRDYTPAMADKDMAAWEDEFWNYP